MSDWFTLSYWKTLFDWKFWALWLGGWLVIRVALSLVWWVWSYVQRTKLFLGLVAYIQPLAKRIPEYDTPRQYAPNKHGEMKPQPKWWERTWTLIHRTYLVVWALGMTIAILSIIIFSGPGKSSSPGSPVVVPSH